MTPVTDEPRPYPPCRFCGRENRRGIAGPDQTIYICFDCIDLVAEMKDEHLAEDQE